jgi:hypothetical protein
VTYSIGNEALPGLRKDGCVAEAAGGWSIQVETTSTSQFVDGKLYLGCNGDPLVKGVDGVHLWVDPVSVFCQQLTTYCSAPAPQTLESDHPYENNFQTSKIFSYPGASSLSISFDDQSRVEAGYDFVRFYKDESLSEQWGIDYPIEHRGDFPGLGIRPPLVIPADHFVLFFMTDGSSADWGWKVTITPSI